MAPRLSSRHRRNWAGVERRASPLACLQDSEWVASAPWPLLSCRPLRRYVDGPSSPEVVGIRAAEAHRWSRHLLRFRTD